MWPDHGCDLRACQKYHGTPSDRQPQCGSLVQTTGGAPVYTFSDGDKEGKIHLSVSNVLSTSPPNELCVLYGWYLLEAGCHTHTHTDIHTLTKVHTLTHTYTHTHTHTHTDTTDTHTD